ncbi:MAG: lysophospholipid acyltransferase family protein, partial [Cyclobacteriaceae bacterium]
MNKVGYILYQPYKWLFFIPFLALNTIFFGLLTIILSYITSSKIASYIGGSIWAKLNTIFTPMLVNVKGRENISKKQSYIIVANHLSLYDIFLIYGWLGVDFKWVMKMELRKIPFLGPACERLDHVFVDRTNRKASLDSIEKAKKDIRNGTSIVFFPEGTRNRSTSMVKFKKGAFIMALQLQLPVLPITINGTNRILPTGTVDLRPGKAEMIIHEAIPIENYSEENL